ncbi:hypothetical protein N665_0149s0023 [Sinapis alba]|nr:hypothetical protein N665_0149s0023 [Sinapis alba]
MKGLFWKAAKSCNTPQYNKRVNELKAYDMDIYNSMMMKNPKNCSLAYFAPASSCDDVSNNISESLNHARFMMFVEMLETIRRKAMLRIEAKRLKAMSIDESSDMSGMPCHHALKIISEKKRKPEDYMGNFYLTSKWRMQYQTPIKAVRRVNFWEKTNESEIVPRPTGDTNASYGRKKIPKRMKGRNESPSKKKAKDKQKSPTKVSREKRSIHCGICGIVGHNLRKCTNIGVEIQRPPKNKKTISHDETSSTGGSSQPMLSQVID